MARLDRVVVSARLTVVLPLAAALIASARPAAQHASVATGGPTSSAVLTKETRRAFIRRAQVWTPTDVGRMDLRSGPTGPDAFEPNETIACDYTTHDMPGNTRKFYCALPGGNVVKVRYGAQNGEVQGSVLATRLLWALGFPADRVYPVRVRCRGCSADPWHDRTKHDGIREFDPAVIELKPPGHEMAEGGKRAGWTWPELDEVDARYGGAPREQRDALKLLAVFMQHTDTKREQQRLLCGSHQLLSDHECLAPFLMLHDVGLTFGRANTFNRNGTGSVNLEAWAGTPVWRDPDRCIGHLSKSSTGTLDDPQISEAGRLFLATLLRQLTEHQVWDLFAVAGLDRAAHLKPGAAGTQIGQWVSVFNDKRREIVDHRCSE